jgi:hypothetical protein
MKSRGCISFDVETNAQAKAVVPLSFDIETNIVDYPSFPQLKSPRWIPVICTRSETFIVVMIVRRPKVESFADEAWSSQGRVPVGDIFEVSKVSCRGIASEEPSREIAETTV